MLDARFWALIWTAFPFVALGFLIYAVHRSGRMQQINLQKYDETKSLQIEMMERQRRMLELTEESVEMQHEIHALLERMATALERRV
jgi:hypothetical protein